MAQFSNQMVEHLKSGVTTLCRCWRLTRTDGVEFGFTDHDDVLDFNGFQYTPNQGMDATALEGSTGLSVDNSQVVGALGDAGITDADIELGLYDRAEISQYLVNWADPTQNAILFKGTIGEIKRGSGAFEAELRGLSEALNQPVGRAYLRKCDASLGDGRCGVDLETLTYRKTGWVTHSVGARVLYLKRLSGFESGWFTGGTFEFLTGENKGVKGAIKTDQKDGSLHIIELWEDLRFDIGIDDRIRVYAGCDKSCDTCISKFSNLSNFRGFPFMPGEDWALSYPTRTSDNDGGSLG